jgi:hypothetical protein
LGKNGEADGIDLQVGRISGSCKRLKEVIVEARGDVLGCVDGIGARGWGVGLAEGDGFGAGERGELGGSCLCSMLKWKLILSKVGLMEESLATLGVVATIFEPFVMLNWNARSHFYFYLCIF